METIIPTKYDCCGKAPTCPCFEKIRNTCLYDYCQAVLADDKTTADSASRPESSVNYSKKSTRDAVRNNANKITQRADLSRDMDINKVTCPRCLKVHKILEEVSEGKKSAIFGLCDHCNMKAQKNAELEQKRLQMHRKQKEYPPKISGGEYTTRIYDKEYPTKITGKERVREMLQKLKRESLSEINIVLHDGEHVCKSTKLMSHSESHFLETDKNVNFKTSHELVELYQSSTFGPLSMKKGSDTEVRSDHSKMPHGPCPMKPISEPTLMADGIEHKLEQYQKLMQSKVKTICGFDKGMTFYFPMVAKEEFKRHVSSSELIKMAREKQRQDNEKNRIIREEKERLARERRKLDRKKMKHTKESKEVQIAEDSKEPDEPREPKEPKGPKEPKEHKGPKEPKDGKGSKESHMKGVQKNKEDTEKDDEMAKLIKSMREKREQDKLKVESAKREDEEKKAKKIKKRKPKSPPKIKIPTPESSVVNAEGAKIEIDDVIVSERVYKNKIAAAKALSQNPLMQGVGEEVAPILFKTKHSDEALEVTIYTDTERTKSRPEEVRHDKELRGVTNYALSDRSFIEKGWTVLPVEKVVRKMNVYRMRPAQPEFDWFEHNKSKRLLTYDSGDKLAEFDDNGRGRWFYRNGRLALDYYDAEEPNAQRRYVVYSSGQPDDRGRARPVTVLATFDHLGNGVVFDHAGKIRLKYNQTDGIVLDREIGPVSHWKWHTLNDPPVLQQVMIDTQMPHKDPKILKMGGPSEFKRRQDNEEMLAIEFDNFIKEKSKKMSQTFKPFQIRMKALKINEHFSLKVLDQANIYLIYRDGSTNLKQNIGMILDPQEIVDTDIADLGLVACNMERFPARTESIAALQRTVAYVQHYEKTRTERDRMLRPSGPCISADVLTAVRSKPLRPPLNTVTALRSTFVGGTEYCKCDRKPPSGLYYNSRL